MFRIIVKLIILISITSNIISCKHNDKSTSGKNQDKPVLFTFKTLDRSNNPLQDVVVQINNDTENTKITDAKGLVSFSNLNKNTKYDIHFFGPTGYEWHSIYNVKPDLVKTMELEKLTTQNSQTLPKSYIKLKGTLTNLSNNNFPTFTYFANYDDSLSSISFSSSNNDYTAKLSTDLPLGSKLVGDLWILRESYDLATSTSYITDAVKYPNVSITTTSETGKATIQNIVLNTVKPVLQNLFTINSVLPPTGVAQDSLNVLNQSFRSNTTTKSKDVMLYSKSIPGNFPLDINAYDPFKLDNYYLSLMASFSPAGNSEWFYIQKVASGANVNIQSHFDNLPQIASNQIGGTIRWNLTSGTDISYQLIEITKFNATNNLETKWNLTIDKNTSELTLPSLPKSVTPILKQGSQYNIGLTVVASDFSLFTSKLGSIIETTFFENVTSNKVTWTR